MIAPPSDSSTQFSHAVRLLADGNLPQAEQSFRRVLAQDPRHIEAHHLLGVTLSQRGQQEQAAAHIGQALLCGGKAAAHYSNLGIVLKKLDRADDAIMLFERAIALQPNYADALANLASTLLDQARIADAEAALARITASAPPYAMPYYRLGNSLEERGEHARAVMSFRRAVACQPDYADAHVNLGNALRADNQLEAAVASFRRAVQLRPDFAPPMVNLARALEALDQTEEAIAVLRHTIALQSDLLAARISLASILRQTKRCDEAEADLRAAIELLPDNAELWALLAGVLQDTTRLDEALAAYRTALALHPDDPVALTNMGNTLRRLHRGDEAVPCYQRAIALDPRCYWAYGNLGVIQHDRRELHDALLNFRRALEIQPDYALAHNNLGLVLLTLGQFEEGWREQEWRWTVKDNVGGVLRHQSKPMWRGENAEGRTILLWFEQGLGDSIQFARYAPILRDMGWKVVLEVQGTLVPLMATMPGIVVVQSGKPLPHFDLQCPLMSVPGVLGTTLATIARNFPYLLTHTPRIEMWRQRLPQDGLRVGIVWQGNPKHGNDHNRSFRLRHFDVFGKIPGVHLISLQKLHGLEQLQDLPHGMQVITLGEDYDRGNFAETAALLMALDLIITPDTAVAHLAGAFGRRVWVGIPHLADWRWLEGREDSPWYPTMRLFRQTGPGGWAPVFARMEQALRALV